ncbi:hypothetical protein SAMN04488102_1169 [Alkalibacterium subtropicum]|uniref:Uncharacterized protein n=1 Tax=Alkalibacterium subtropicum TaxID=753702 RepID=A0A1I1L5D7_9LACT|nr:hypothetical protein [Alkalibacterium subtropicum]SFC65643.1 hypothetical protein SAMN04488102_1169 [Alkalibacterium subtropicum]
MENIVSNPMFSAIVSLFVGIVIWYGLTDEPACVKKSVVSVFMDTVFYFVAALFGINAVLNISEVIQVPYRILLFSSNVVWIASLGVLIYGSYLYGSKLWKAKEKSKSAAKLLTAVGLANHSYMYYRYASVTTLLLIVLFVSLLALLTFTNLTQKVSPIAIASGFGALHLLIMGTRSVIYFNFVFTPLAILSLFLVFSGLLLGYKRGILPSKQN